MRTVCLDPFNLKVAYRPYKAVLPECLVRITPAERVAGAGGALLAAPMAFARGARHSRRFRESGSALVELTVVLFMVLTLSVLCFQTMLSGWLLQNWTLAQSMTNACVAIETANAQRWVFNEIVTSGRWSLYPQTVAVQFQIGSTPRGAVNTTIYRTYHFSQDPVTGLQTYLLESYVVYQDSLRTYCKLSKVVRSE